MLLVETPRASPSTKELSSFAGNTSLLHLPSSIRSRRKPTGVRPHPIQGPPCWCIDGPARLRELCGGGLQRSFAGQDDHEGCDLTKGHVPHTPVASQASNSNNSGREKERYVELFGRRCTVLTPAAGHELQFTPFQWNQHLLQNEDGIVTVSRNIQRKLNGFTARPLMVKSPTKEVDGSSTSLT